MRDAANGSQAAALTAAVAGYLNTVATVKHMDLAAAVKGFVDGREAETKSVNGKDHQQLVSVSAPLLGTSSPDFIRQLPPAT